MPLQTANIIKAVLVGIVMFLIGAVAEAVITVWVFRKYGGCPFQKN